MDNGIIIGIITFVAFAYATVLAFLRHKQKQKINLWCLIALALFILSLSSLMCIFEHLIASDVMNIIFNHIEVTFLLVGSTLLFSVFCVYYKSCRSCEKNPKLFY